MKNTRYVKVTASFVLCYDDALDAIPKEMGNVDAFLLAGVEAAFIAKNQPNRGFISVCPYAKMTASLIHAPRSLPQALAQTQDQISTFLTRKQLHARDAERARLQAEQDAEVATERKEPEQPPARKERRMVSRKRRLP